MYVYVSKIFTIFMKQLSYGLIFFCVKIAIFLGIIIYLKKQTSKIYINLLLLFPQKTKKKRVLELLEAGGFLVKEHLLKIYILLFFLVDLLKNLLLFSVLLFNKIATLLRIK